MKKIILAAVILSTLTMCNKADLEKANKTIANADSLVDKASETIEQLDSAIAIDSLNLKTKDLILNKEEIEKTFEKSKGKIDSLSKNLDEFKENLKDKKVQTAIDSIKSKIKTETPKAVTKIIYKEKPAKKEAANQDNFAMVKSGSVEINVDNISNSKQSLKEIIAKYDGVVKTENTVSTDEYQTFYLSTKIPFDKYDYLVEDLRNVGTIRNKNIEVKGDHYNPKKLCDLEITLYSNFLQSQELEKEKSFGEKSIDAISSGWQVIGNILLFLLPFWPIFIIAGIGYYFYKKKTQSKNQDSGNQDNPDIS